MSAQKSYKIASKVAAALDENEFKAGAASICATLDIIGRASKIEADATEGTAHATKITTYRFNVWEWFSKYLALKLPGATLEAGRIKVSGKWWLPMPCLYDVVERDNFLGALSRGNKHVFIVGQD